MRPVFYWHPFGFPLPAGGCPLLASYPPFRCSNLIPPYHMSKRKDPENENNEGVFEKTSSLPNLHATLDGISFKSSMRKNLRVGRGTREAANPRDERRNPNGTLTP